MLSAGHDSYCRWELTLPLSWHYELADTP
jgi:hypothetical protein